MNDHHRNLDWHRVMRPEGCPECEWEIAQNVMRWLAACIFIPMFLISMLFIGILIGNILNGRYF